VLPASKNLHTSCHMPHREQGCCGGLHHTALKERGCKLQGKFASNELFECRLVRPLNYGEASFREGALLRLLEFVKRKGETDEQFKAVIVANVRAYFEWKEEPATPETGTQEWAAQ
jgi:hypothetical protein